MSLPQPELIHHIMDAAREFCEQDRATIAVKYSSVANHLHITVKEGWAEPPTLDECIELHKPDDSEFTKRRVVNRLTEVANTLDSMLFRIPRPAA